MPTVSVFYNMLDDDLMDKDNVVKDLTPELKDFILSMPPVAVHEDKVNDVKSEGFEEMRKMMEAQLEKLCD
eukprot:12949455-Heterocapsa_arctica.AAC.1